jgi:hypothetical protein
MSFTWTQSVTQYTNIEKVDIDEIRTNCDWLNNNRSMYCSTHYSPYCSTHYSGHRQTHYNADRAGHYVTYLTGYQNYLATCFPSSTKILLCNGRWMSIEDIRPGDEVMSFYGNCNKVLDIYHTTLGDRFMMGFSDESLFFTPEESLWAKNDKEEYWTVSNYNMFLAEENLNYFINGVSYARYGLKRKKPILQIHEMKYAHLNGWIEHIPRTYGRKKFDVSTVVYNLIPDGDSTYFVNGYITYGAISDEFIDYTKYEWKRLKNNIDNMIYFSDSKMVERK